MAYCSIPIKKDDYAIKFYRKTLSTHEEQAVHFIILLTIPNNINNSKLKKQRRKVKIRMKIKANRWKLIFLLSVSFLIQSYSQVRLPRLISDGMVLQRDYGIIIWGWAGAYEKISLQFIDSTYNITASKAGEWNIILKGLKAGGPYKMQINATNAITISDILIGDVWICSGQSNMELPMKRVRPLYQSEIANSENQFIRNLLFHRNIILINLKKIYDSAVGSQQIRECTYFSAVAYFFAKELYDKV